MWTLADSNGYYLDGQVYLGKRGVPEANQSYRVVTELVQPFYES